MKKRKPRDGDIVNKKGLNGILNIVLKVFGLKKEVLDINCRIAREARDMYLTVSFEDTHVNCEKIGKKFDMDRSHVSQSIKNFRKKLDVDKNLQNYYETIKRKVNE